jgi:hypothetical protein
VLKVSEGQLVLLDKGDGFVDTRLDLGLKRHSLLLKFSDTGLDGFQ